MSDLCFRASNNTPAARNRSKWPYGLHIVVVVHYFSSTAGVQSTLQEDKKRRPLLLGELTLQMKSGWHLESGKRSKWEERYAGKEKGLGRRVLVFIPTERKSLICFVRFSLVLQAF